MLTLRCRLINNSVKHRVKLAVKSLVHLEKTRHKVHIRLDLIHKYYAS